MLLKADTKEMVQLAKAFDAAALAVAQNRPTILRALGVQMLSWGFQDYRIKSRGGPGGDGITWPPTKATSVVGRVRKLKAYKAKSASVRKARKELREARINLRKAKAVARVAVRGSAAYKSAGKTIKAARAKIKTHTRKLSAAKSAGKTPVVKRIRSQIRGLKVKATAAKAKRLAMRSKLPTSAARTVTSKTRQLQKSRESKRNYVQKQLAGAKIGIDTGRLVNSLIYGVPGLKMQPVTGNPTKPKDEPVKEAIFAPDHNGITVGTNMSYAKHFDADRPIFGPGFLNADRQRQLGDLAARAHQIALRQAAEKKQPKPIGDSELAGNS
jgi:hypothetical protein